MKCIFVFKEWSQDSKRYLQTFTDIYKIAAVEYLIPTVTITYWERGRVSFPELKVSSRTAVWGALGFIFSSARALHFAEWDTDREWERNIAGVGQVLSAWSTIHR